MTGKIYFFGAKDSGKTQLINIITSFDFEPMYKPTSSSTPRNYRDVELWDISEEEPNNSSISEESDVAVYCLDLSKSLNEEQVNKDLENFRIINKKAPIFLVGTKIDLERKISNEQFQQLLKQHKFTKGFELSARKNDEAVSKFSAKLFKKTLSPEKKAESAKPGPGFFPRVNDSWKLSGCQIAILACIPVIGWAVLLAYLIYRSCLVDEEPTPTVNLGCS